MQLALVLDGFASYGGQQQLCYGLIQALSSRGHGCRLYAIGPAAESATRADLPTAAQLCPVPPRGLHDAARQRNALAWVQRHLQTNPVEALVGFSPMPGLDVLLYGGGCYAAGQDRASAALSTFTGRHRQILQWEAAAFGALPSAEACARIFLLDQCQANTLGKHYGASASRLRVLPPLVAMQEPTAAWLHEQRRTVRPAARAQLGLAEGDFALLHLGAVDDTGGIDRALACLAQIQKAQPSANTRLLVSAGEASPGVRRLVKQMKLVDAVRFVGSDVEHQALLLAADVLLAPDRDGACGRALLVATAAGLPVVATQCSAYAELVRAARSGIVLPEPFAQEAFDRAVMRYIDGIFRADSRDNALDYARAQQLYNLWALVADLIEVKSAAQ
ncbi:MAG: glycosyltransferase [Gammaproteobacteria bacterium]|nr:glycosyltransferase [Gammaproteobacteria bacterium]